MKARILTSTSTTVTATLPHKPGNLPESLTVAGDFGQITLPCVRNKGDVRSGIKTLFITGRTVKILNGTNLTQWFRVGADIEISAAA